MRLQLKHCIGGLALCAMALPLWAHTVPLSVSQPATIQGTELQPGTYQIKVPNDGTQMKVVNSDGKVVAQVPCHWVNLQQKADDTEVVFQQNKITEIEFGGQTHAVKVD